MVTLCNQFFYRICDDDKKRTKFHWTSPHNLSKLRPSRPQVNNLKNDQSTDWLDDLNSQFFKLSDLNISEIWKVGKKKKQGNFRKKSLKIHFCTLLLPIITPAEELLIYDSWCHEDLINFNSSKQKKLENFRKKLLKNCNFSKFYANYYNYRNNVYLEWIWLIVYRLSHGFIKI